MEAVILRTYFQMHWARALTVSVVINSISAIAGVILIPLAGIAWEVFPGALMYWWGNIGTFNPFTWGATFTLATVVTTGIEVTCLKRLFKLPAHRRTWVVWLLANSATVGLAFWSLFPFVDDTGAYRAWLFR